ncbi:MAG: type III pantothenate kinase [Candidatus Latescibacterota bacterium]|jgi:type III pantothenate kinase
MLLAIDIGNTHIDLGLFLDDQLQVHSKWQTRRDARIETYQEDLQHFLQTANRTNAIECVLISAVVSDLDRILADLCRALGMQVRQVDSRWDLGLHIDYDDPDRVGIDRLLAAAAAFERAPSGHGAVIADAGTAITVDLVDARGHFLGGAIAPGLYLMLGAMNAGTSLLPAIELSDDVPLVGKNTPDGMRSGALHGAAALVDGLCLRMGESQQHPLTRTLTGGDGERLFRLTRHFDHCEPALVLHGLALAYRRLLTA